MKLRVERFKSKDKCTIGKLFINDKFSCFTLEDEIRPLMSKVFGETAIPQGTYTLIMSFSNRFQEYKPEILNVPNFKGIRIHTGNTAKESKGCLLVGNKTDGKSVFESRMAYAKLIAEIKTFEKSEKITIEYINTNLDYK